MQVSLKNESELDEFMSCPSDRLVDYVAGLEGDIAIVGAAGKIGVTLAMMASRAVKASKTAKKVYAISRFSDPSARKRIEKEGVAAIACDLLDQDAVAKLPEAANVLFLAGRKFGTQGAQDLTWATNTLAPAYVARRYSKSRIVAYSTGCVYDFRNAVSGGSVERDPPEATGEYAQSTLGRERVFEYYSRAFGTKVCQFRLNYAIDLRYGVLRDIADKVYAGLPVDLSSPSYNCIWQGDVLERTILSLGLCDSPPAIINISGPETASVRWTAEEFALRFGKSALFKGEEKPEARTYLSNAAQSFKLFGYPSVSLLEMIDMTAEWIAAGGSSLGKPTHFEVTDGKY